LSHRRQDHGQEEASRREAFSVQSWDLGRAMLSAKRRPLVMGILNLTPDSFHAASRRQGAEAAAQAAREMAEAGADLLDLGAESSRPGAEPVSPQEELDRLLPVLQAARKACSLPLTVDTYRADTARAALAAGADAVNDISAGSDPGMFPLCAELGCGLILMHMRGTPKTMQQNVAYENVVTTVRQFLQERCEAALAAGIQRKRLLVDPGIGFGKTPGHNLDLLRHLDRLGADYPLLLGASRKSFIGHLTGAEAQDRLPGSLAALAAAFQTRSFMVRVHDVAESVQFLDVLAALNGATSG
jgi:dihydropteroate synthase